MGGNVPFLLSVARSCIYVALGFFLAATLRPYPAATPCPSPPRAILPSAPPCAARVPAGAPAPAFLSRPFVPRAAALAAAPAPARAHAPAAALAAAGAPRPPPPKAFFAALVARLVAQDVLGRADAGFIAHYLPRYYAAGSVWDIGANKGDTSQVLIAALVPGFFCFKFYELTQTAGGSCRPWTFPFYGVEMNPRTAAVLRKRAAFEKWDMLSYEVVEAGFSDGPGEGRLAAGEDGEGSETASLVGGAAGAAPGAGAAVPLHSVDSWRAARGEASAPIFLLKIDTEGFDGKVIKGAEKALAGKHVKFLVAEYNSMWAGVRGAGGGAPEWSLRSSTAFLWALGYECHLLNEQHFVPLWGEWFHASYEFWAHSNFICAPHCDADLLHLVAAARNASLPLLERADCPRAGGGSFRDGPA